MGSARRDTSSRLDPVMRNPYWRCLLLVVCVLSGADGASAQAPTKYRASVRYAINPPRAQPVVQYDAMTRSPQRLGFESDPPLEKHPDTDREDRTKQYLEGAIPAAKA